MGRFLGVVPALVVCGCAVRERVEFVEARHPLSIQGVIVSLAGGVGEDGLSRLLIKDGVLRPATADELIALKRAGASDRFVVGLIRTPVTRPRAASLVVYRWYELDGDAFANVAVLPLRALAFLFSLGGWDPPVPRTRRSPYSVPSPHSEDR